MYDPPPPVRLCINCKHYERWTANHRYWISEDHLCYKNGTYVDLVTGEKKRTPLICANERSSKEPDACGRVGRDFEEAEPK